MFTTGLGLTLRPGAYDSYKKAHDECWPEILKRQQECGVSMVIYRWADRLFVHATAPSEADWLGTRDGPMMDEWNEFMKQFLETDEEGNIRFEALDLAFVTGVFAGD